jgi:hypothetical protein
LLFNFSNLNIDSNLINQLDLLTPASLNAIQHHLLYQYCTATPLAVKTVSVQDYFFLMLGNVFSVAAVGNRAGVIRVPLHCLCFAVQSNAVLSPAA